MTSKAGSPATEDRVLVEVTVPAPADAVWRALRDKEQLAQWFGWDAEGLPAEIDFIFFEHGKADDARKVLSFEGTSDRYEVEARGGESVVRVVRSAPAEGTDWKDIFDDMVEGWIAFTEQLRFALTRHAGQPRRTIFLAGAPRSQGAPNGLPALGLDQPPAPGGSWSGPLGPQPSLQGEGWHRGRFQCGVTVKEWGDGLLVVTGQPAGKRFPNGDTTVTVTTYGLDGAAFTALNERWTAWWATHFVPRTVTGEAPSAP